MIRLLAPRFWALHVAMVVALIAAGLLGYWQWQVWKQHRSAAVSKVAAEPAKPIDKVLGPDAPLLNGDVGRQVTLTGRWLEQTFYISGRTHAGKTGYWVVSPLEVSGTSSAMLVVRGWSAKPEASAMTGAANITGWLQGGESAGSVDENTSDDVFPALRTVSLINRVPDDLYGAFVIARTPTDGLEKVTLPKPDKASWTAGFRNLSYAVEWWIFGAFAVYIWWRWCRDELDREREPEPEEVPTG